MEIKIPRWIVTFVCWLRHSDKIELSLIIAIILIILGIVIPNIYEVYGL